MGVTFLLLTLGSGIGLSLVTSRHATAGGATTFLTMGAIYFLAAQAFGFAVGGHVVGRLIGPALETTREKDFRAGAHGLVSWALAVVATAAIVALSALVAGSAMTSGAVTAALGSTSANGTRGESSQPATTSYWVDKLFRPTTNAQAAALGGRQYAQTATDTATDMPPSNEQPTQLAPGDNQPAASDNAPPSNGYDGSSAYTGGRTTPAAPLSPVTAAPLPTLRPLGADKAEAGRILTVGMANGERLSDEDRTQLAQLVSLDTGLSTAAALHRVDDVAQRIHDDEVAAAEAARKTAAAASLWTAFALLFGALVAVFAAISARWEDDREQGLLPGTRIVETRF
jgi:hypothetical protein